MKKRDFADMVIFFCQKVVELEIKGERYIVSGEELISAIKRAMVGTLL